MAESEADWSTATSPKGTVSPGASITVANGDFIVLGGVTADQTSTISIPTGGSLTYTQQASVNIGSNCWISVWTAPCTSSQTFSLSVARSATSNVWGYNGLLISGGSAVGAVTSNNGASAPSLTMTPQAANSAVAMFYGDWNAADGTSRTYLSAAGTFTEQTYFRDSLQYTVYGGGYLNAGTATSKAFGLSAPTGAKWVGVAVEIKAAASTPPTIRSLFVAQAIKRAS